MKSANKSSLQLSKEHHQEKPDTNSIFFGANQVISLSTGNYDVYGGMTLNEFEQMIEGLQSMAKYMRGQ